MLPVSHQPVPIVRMSVSSSAADCNCCSGSPAVQMECFSLTCSVLELRPSGEDNNRGRLDKVHESCSGAVPEDAAERAENDFCSTFSWIGCSCSGCNRMPI